MRGPHINDLTDRPINIIARPATIFILGNYVAEEVIHKIRINTVDGLLCPPSKPVVPILSKNSASIVNVNNPIFIVQPVGQAVIDGVCRVAKNIAGIRRAVFGGQFAETVKCVIDAVSFIQPVGMAGVIITVGHKWCAGRNRSECFAGNAPKRVHRCRVFDICQCLADHRIAQITVFNQSLALITDRFDPAQGISHIHNRLSVRVSNGGKQAALIVSIGN